MRNFWNTCVPRDSANKFHQDPRTKRNGFKQGANLQISLKGFGPNAMPGPNENDIDEVLAGLAKLVANGVRAPLQPRW